MYIVYADRKADAADRPLRRSFEAEAFSQALAPDRTSGTVCLQPGGVRLRVGTAEGDYRRVRIFDRRGALAGSMILADGVVGWTVPHTF
jgi:hypothetical protein